MWCWRRLLKSLGLQGDPTSPFWRKSDLNIHWKDWCWSWNSNILATWCEELTHWKRPWCWAILKAGGEGDDRGWDGWMASPTQWTWVWASSRSWWWTGKPGVLRTMGLQRVRHDWETELNWTDLNVILCFNDFDIFDVVSHALGQYYRSSYSHNNFLKSNVMYVTRCKLHAMFYWLTISCFPKSPLFNYPVPPR